MSLAKKAAMGAGAGAGAGAAAAAAGASSSSSVVSPSLATAPYNFRACLARRVRQQVWNGINQPAFPTSSLHELVFGYYDNPLEQIAVFFKQDEKTFANELKIMGLPFTLTHDPAVFS